MEMTRLDLKRLKEEEGRFCCHCGRPEARETTAGVFLSRSGTSEAVPVQGEKSYDIQ